MGKWLFITCRPVSSRTTAFNSEIVPAWRHLNSGCAMRTVFIFPKAWHPKTPMLLRRLDRAPSIVLLVVLSCSRWSLNSLLFVKLTGRSPVYMPAPSHWPPSPSSKPSNRSSPSVNRTSQFPPTVRLMRPFSLLTDSVVSTALVLSTIISWSFSTP